MNENYYDEVKYPKFSNSMANELLDLTYNEYQVLIQKKLDDYVKNGFAERNTPKDRLSLKNSINALRGRATQSYRLAIKLIWLEEFFKANNYLYCSKYINNISENVFGDIVNKNIINQIPNKPSAPKNKSYSLFDDKLLSDPHIEEQIFNINEDLFLRGKILLGLLSVDYDTYKVRKYEVQSIEKYKRDISTKIQSIIEFKKAEFKEIADKKEKLLLMRHLESSLKTLSKTKPKKLKM